MFEVKKDINPTLSDRLALPLILADYGIRNSILRVLENTLFVNKNIFAAQRILIFRKGGMGDAVSSLPAIHAIKNCFPNAEIDLLTARRLPTQAGLEEIVEKGTFSNVYTYTNLFDRDMISQLCGRKYDLYIELPSNIASFSFELRTLWLVKRIGIPSGIGWRVSSTKFIAKKQEKLLSFLNDNDRLLKILKGYGFEVEQGDYQLPVPEKDAAYVHELLKEHGIIHKERNIAMIPGAGRPQNKWPLPYFNEVAKYYQAKGFNIILIGGEEERKEADKIEGENVFNFCGKLTALQSAAMLKNCCISISNDTGPMHLSYSAGTPVVAIFSARDYAGKWFPPKEGNIVLRNTGVPCAICFSDTCIDNICMKQIKPEEVIKAVDLTLTLSQREGNNVLRASAKK